MKVGYQGVEGAFSYIASKKMFGEAELVAFPSFFDVLEAIENNKIDCGVLPIENSYAGRVAGMHNLFRDFRDKNLFIIKEKLLKVEHCLCALPDAKLENITHIFSHEQALMQCQKNIIKNLPNAKCEAKANTAISAQFVAESGNANFSAICSREAGEKYGLKVLKPNFQDAQDENHTLFVALSKKQNHIKTTKENNVLTSLIFELKNCPGSLYYSLGCFEEQKIDLLKIESYIPIGKSSSALFFTTIRANVDDEKTKLALEKLKQFTNNIYILGSYLENK